MATVAFTGIITPIPQTGKMAITFDTMMSNSVLIVDPSAITSEVEDTADAQQIECNSDDFFTLTRSNGAAANMTFEQFFDARAKQITGDSTQGVAIGFSAQ